MFVNFKISLCLVIAVLTLPPGSLGREFSETPIPGIDTTSGKKIFETNCVRCHGNDGTKGKFGAKNLQKTGLSDNELFRVISDGKRIMPGWKHKLSADEIDSVKEYVKTLDNNPK
ncbi:MAG TPA: cytochrome c [Flavitalea sp.]|nr:cytochrome c [Flavitalea sp.]